MGTDQLTGLTAAEVAARTADGRVNGRATGTSRSVHAIVRANAVTRFNLLLGALFAALLVVHATRDTLFIWVVLVNLVVGVAQELRARYTLDRLQVIDEAPVRVRRDGVDQLVDAAEVVEDDLVLIARGDQVPVDGTVVDAQACDLDEALLTGEADPVPKPVGATVRSGSVVVAGAATMRATAVGERSYARRLSREARSFALARSELRLGTDVVLRAITWVMAPLGLLLLWSQLVANESVASAIQGTVAGVSAMVPEGLVLLTSIAFAAGVVRLGRRKVLTRELAAVEGLARVDVLCIDKTGTLTEPAMQVDAVESVALGPAERRPSALGPAEDAGEPAVPTGPEPAEVLAALAALEDQPNPTLAAIRHAFGADPSWTVEEVTPFSSQRRWSGATFRDRGTWSLGAPEALLEPCALTALQPQLERHTSQGRRVVVLTSGEAAPARHPEAVVALAEVIKPDVAETLAHFRREDVAIKVLSGDHPATVAAIARRAGLSDAGPGVDASSLPEGGDELAAAMSSDGVFGRVSPERKQAMIAALQARGHTVAMTGDGVNDLLALKQADVAIAMGQGSAASRAVAQFVLLDGGLAAMPAVLAEGRRVVANIERVAGLFVSKSVYAAVLALATGVAQLPFPLLPRQLSLIGGLSIGLPGFLLALERNAGRARPGYVRRVLSLALPAGMVAAVATFAAYADARSDGAGLAAARTTASVVLFVVAGVILALVARPWTRARVTMMVGLGVTFAGALALPAARRYFEFAAPPATTWATSAALALAAGGVLLLGDRLRPRFLARSGNGGRRPGDAPHPSTVRAA